MEPAPTTFGDSLTEAQMQELFDRGVLVLPGILTPQECKETISKTWDHLEYASSEWEQPINRKTPSTWRGMRNFSPMHGMLIQHYGIGHIQAATDIRQHPNVHSVFARLHGEEDLITSMDGVSIMPPPEVTNLGWHKSNSSWAHCDTPYTDLYNGDNFLYQSWITPLAVQEGDATLAVMIGSHTYHEALANEFKLGKDVWKLSEEHLTWLEEKGCTWENVVCPAGSMVLWDSRAVHYGAQPQKGRKNKNTRICIYVCMCPRSRSTPAKLKKKVKAFEEGRLTTHDPVPSKLFPKEPRKYPSETALEVPKLPPLPELTPLGRSLVGY